MLRHKQAPLCQMSVSHTVPVDDESDSDSNSNTLDNESDQSETTTNLLHCD